MFVCVFLCDSEQNLLLSALLRLNLCWVILIWIFSDEWVEISRIICGDCHLHFWCAFHIFSSFCLYFLRSFWPNVCEFDSLFFNVRYANRIYAETKMIRGTHVKYGKSESFSAKCVSTFFCVCVSLFFFTLISWIALPQFQIKVFSQKILRYTRTAFLLLFRFNHNHHCHSHTLCFVVCHHLICCWLVYVCIHKCLFWQNGTVFSLINIHY